MSRRVVPIGEQAELDRIRRLLGRPALVVAPRLLGAVVESVVNGASVSVRITEVEAYEGSTDPASHAFRGPTERTASMFGAAGGLYCYFTYGMHWCANVVCREPGVASAVLLRAGAVVAGIEVARERRGSVGPDHILASGPARLARTLALGRDTDGVDLLDPASPVRLIHVRGRRVAGVVAGPRVGISAAVERPWRFWVEGERSVSRYRPGGRPVQAPGPADWTRDR